MKLLLVEDEPRVAQALSRGLREEGHTVDLCSRGDDALAQASLVAYDVIVLDWSLPDQDGVSLLRTLRQRGLGTPVLMLTARGSTGEKVTGLRAGADDYVVKPFDFDELLARLEGLTRRNGPAIPLEVGQVKLDVHRRALVTGNLEQTLTAREYALARELFAHAGDVCTRSALLSAVWGTAFDGNPNVVDVYIGYLRAKLALLEGGVELQTVRGLGYRLVPRGPAA